MYYFSSFFRISVISNQLFINLTDLIYLDLGNNLIGKYGLYSDVGFRKQLRDILVGTCHNPYL